jgi:prepilin-type N-terminal cleavage/methylation domain-containing protein
MQTTPPVRRAPNSGGVSLIELLVVMFIIGVMISLLMPALGAARRRVRATECENNLHQLRIALTNSINVKRAFPAPHRWTVELLPWIGEQPLADLIRTSPNAEGPFPRPPVMQCPLQIDFESRVTGAGFCHYVLIVDRPVPRLSDGVSWDLRDRPKFDEEKTEEPWYVGPEVSSSGYWQIMTDETRPHPESAF